jgi:hypothetical protein
MKEKLRQAELRHGNSMISDRFHHTMPLRDWKAALTRFTIPLGGRVPHKKKPRYLLGSRVSLCGLAGECLSHHPL